MDVEELPPDHPLAFANPFLSDPLAEHLVILYDIAWQTKDECVARSEYECALLIAKFKDALGHHVLAYCRNLAKHQPPQGGTVEGGQGG